MKQLRVIVCFLFFVLAAICNSAMASVPVNPAPRERAPSVVPQGVVVPAWKDLNKTQQEKLQRFAARWDQMPASRRVMILERLEHFERLPPNQQRRLREAAGNYLDLPPRLQDNIRRSMRYVRTLPPDEQKKLRAQWDNITPQHRRAWLEVGGPGLSTLPPAPIANEKPHKKNEQKLN